MLGWLPRGLRKGRVTTRYPYRPETPVAGFQGPIELLAPAPPANFGDSVRDARTGSPKFHPDALPRLCPTGAISVDGGGRLSLDRGRCILCGACVRAAPERFAFSQRFESAARTREALVEHERGHGDGSAGDVGADAGGRDTARPEAQLDASRPGAQLDASRRALAAQARALRRSIHVRHIDTGSDGAEEWEIQSLWNPYYDIQRLGFFLTASPRHADILLVSGGVTAPMREPLERTWELMPHPKALVAVGTDACSGGLSVATGLTAGGVDQVLPVDVYLPGSPPPPVALIDALLLAVGLLRAGDRR